MRFRFSLRTLLILMVIVCVVLGLTTNQFLNVYGTAERHRKALQVLSGNPFLHDGFYQLENGRLRNAPPSDSRWVDFARQRIHPLAYIKMSKMYVTSDWSAHRHTFKELRNLNGLHELSANIDDFTKEDAKQINAIPELRECIFGVTGPVDTTAMASVASNPRLKKFILHPTDSETCSAIANNRSLIEVGVGGKGFSPEDMQTICKSRSIEKLILINAVADLKMLAPLSQLPQLKAIELGDVRAVEETFAELSKLRLIHIAIEGPSPGVKFPVTKLSENPELQRFTSHCPIAREPNDIKSFTKCSKLEELSLTECVIDAESLNALRECPALKIAAFSGDLPDELAQAFVDAIPGRQLTLYANGLWRSHEKPNGKREFTSTKKPAPKTK